MGYGEGMTSDNGITLPHYQQRDNHPSPFAHLCNEISSKHTQKRKKKGN
jgi:hypothetical protein